MPPSISGERPKRRRRVYACDSCYRKKVNRLPHAFGHGHYIRIVGTCWFQGDSNILEIKCDGALPRCDWCHHHSIPCTYDRNEDLPPRKTPNTKLKLVHYSLFTARDLGFQMQLSACRMAGGANRSQDTPCISREHTSRTRLVPLQYRLPALILFVEQVQITSRSPYPTPGPQAVAPQGFGATICFAGQSLGNIGGFNGLPVFSAAGIEWIKARTGEEVTLDWYRTRSIQTPPRGNPQHLPLPDIRILRQLLENYQRTLSHRMFPVINIKCFEYTIRAAYNHELSEISPGPASARSCIFAFMALSSFVAGAGTESTITYTDKFAQEVYDLMPEVISESVTLDGLQAILMLVSLQLLQLLPPTY